MRLEKDSLGSLELQDANYFGIQTERARHNFSVSGQTFERYPQLLWSMAMIKKAAALANRDIGALEGELAEAVCEAAKEIADGQMASQFTVDVYQGGGGTSINMNVNEVLANRANEILTGRKGYTRVHPNTHVNMGQSTNDVVPSAIKMACYLYLGELQSSLVKIEKALSEKVEEFADIVKIGRTCLQDAVPLTLGQQFSGYLSFVQRQTKIIENVKKSCLILTIGGTAIGTGIGTFPGYVEKFYEHLCRNTNIPFQIDANLFDGFQNVDGYLHVSSALKSLSTGLSKMASDFRLLSSGPRAGLSELSLPAVQPGSSIMPGKVNPVIPEMMIQVCFQVYGNDQTITMAVDRGELELNVWEPLIMKNLFESCQLLTNSIALFTDRCIVGLQANRKICQQYATSSLSLSTVLSSLYGYEFACELTKEAHINKKTIKEIVVEKQIMSDKMADQLLDPVHLTSATKSSELIKQYQNK